MKEKSVILSALTVLLVLLLIPVLSASCLHAPVQPQALSGQDGGPPQDLSRFDQARQRDLASGRDLAVVPDLAERPPAVIEGPPCTGPWELLFDLDAAVIRKENQPLLEQVAACAKLGAKDLGVVGSADERGPEPHNLLLGQKRASAVSSALAGLGVPQSRLHPQSIGDSGPVCGAHEEACWQRNRRVVVQVQVPLCQDHLCGMDSACSCHEVGGQRRCWSSQSDCEVDAACCSARKDCRGMNATDTCVQKTRAERSRHPG